MKIVEIGFNSNITFLFLSLFLLGKTFFVRMKRFFDDKIIIEKCIFFAIHEE